MVGMHFGMVDSYHLELLHGAGKQLHAWTINHMGLMRRVLVGAPGGVSFVWKGWLQWGESGVNNATIRMRPQIAMHSSVLGVAPARFAPPLLQSAQGPYMMWRICEKVGALKSEPWWPVICLGLLLVCCYGLPGAMACKHPADLSCACPLCL